MPRTAIAVVGAGVCDERSASVAYDVGRLVAQRGALVVSGGMSGVMEAASRGARDAGGIVVGILPGLNPSDANPAVDVAIPTGMGQLRNGLVVNCAQAVIAVAGEWGTLSEIAFVLKLGKPVVAWHSWSVKREGPAEDRIVRVETAVAAVDQAFLLIDSPMGRA